MPQVRSHRVCCVSVPCFFDSLSVRLMFQKVDMCAPCNAVFTQPPHLVSAQCIHGTRGPDEITQFTAALSSGRRQQGTGNWWTGHTVAPALLLRKKVRIYFHPRCHPQESESQLHKNSSVITFPHVGILIFMCKKCVILSFV